MSDPNPPRPWHGWKEPPKADLMDWAIGVFLVVSVVFTSVFALVMLAQVMLKVLL